MHKSRLGALIVDCETEDLHREAAFWSAALGAAAESSEAQRNPRYVRLQGRPGEVQTLLQAVDHPSRVHLDIETDDIPAEVERLEALGAVVVETLAEWTVMQAPSGHRFCVIGPVRAGFEENANVWR
jgi:predicted enzyme related to lactoylglutathione lyase